MNNKYVRGLVVILAGLVILVVLLLIGDLIAIARGAEQSLSLLPGDNLLGWWGLWVIVGGLVLYLIYVFFARTDMFKIGTREVVMMAIGAALYGVLTFLFNIVPVPSVSLVALRPVVVIPIFFGFAFGPAVGFFVGAFGNVLGDALTGWGVYPIWDIGNGLMGLVPGLAGMYLGRTRGKINILQWIAVAVLAVCAILPLVSPSIIHPWTGEPTTEFLGWWYIMLAVLIVMLGLTLAPRFWPYVLLLLTLAFLGFAVYYVIAPPADLEGSPLPGAILLGAIAVVCGLIAYYLSSRARDITRWLDEKDTTALVVWASLGVIVGIGFAAIADIFYNGYSFTTAIIGEFIPAAGPNILFAVILTPLLYAAWKQARAGAGR
ncbi:MAG: ECF transporter S component [Anaerolineae bacterium]|nr:ECF transporter S component [Anaerolineae bacterium]